MPAPLLPRSVGVAREAAVPQNATATYIALYMSAAWLLIGALFLPVGWTLVGAVLRVKLNLSFG